MSNNVSDLKGGDLTTGRKQLFKDIMDIDDLIFTELRQVLQLFAEETMRKQEKHKRPVTQFSRFRLYKNVQMQVNV